MSFIQHLNILFYKMNCNIQDKINEIVQETSNLENSIILYNYFCKTRENTPKDKKDLEDDLNWLRTRADKLDRFMNNFSDICDIPTDIFFKAFAIIQKIEYL